MSTNHVTAEPPSRTGLGEDERARLSRLLFSAPTTDELRREDAIIARKVRDARPSARLRSPTD